MNDDIDLLLSRPLEEPADAGFSTRVLARVEEKNTRGDVVETIAMILAGAVIVALLPLTGVGQQIAQAAAQLAFSVPFALGCGLLLISWMLFRALPE